MQQLLLFLEILCNNVCWFLIGVPDQMLMLFGETLHGNDYEPRVERNQLFSLPTSVHKRATKAFISFIVVPVSAIQSLKKGLIWDIKGQATNLN